MAKLIREDLRFQDLVNDVVDADKESVTAMVIALTNQTNIEVFCLII